MKCKPGDLAVIVMCPRGTEHLRGKIIRVTTLAPPRMQPPGQYQGAEYGPRWYYEGPRMKTSMGFVVEMVNDCCLHPLRGDEAPADHAMQPDLFETN